ncbi:MAG: hypothetical protein HY901_22610, partial [Deltaproteobacteria bacterium]|nr:hypothetical protein [Deltaproteobacteria bacterium]
MTAHRRFVIARQPAAHLLLLAAALWLSGCAASRAARDGEEALGRGDYDAAVAFYEEAVKASPEDEDHRRGLERAKHQGAQAALLDGDGARNAGNLGAAEVRYQKAQHLEATPEAAQRLVAVQEERAQAAGILASARVHLGAGRLEPALLALRSIERYAPTFPELAPLIAQTSRTICDQASAQAQ